MQLALLHHVTCVCADAARTAAFYRDLGFSPRGEPFDEVGIPHIEMAAPLAVAGTR